MPKGKLTYQEITPRKGKRVHPMGTFDRFFGHPFMRGAFKKWSAHGLVPVALGAAVVIVGRSAIEIRSIAVLVCALWLSLDIGIEIAELREKWSSGLEIITLCSLSCIAFCLAMGCMYWFLASLLEDQREDTFVHLRFEHYSLGASEDPLETMFTVINGGGEIISRKHRIICNIRIMVSTDPRLIVENWTGAKINGNILGFTEEDPIQAHIPSAAIIKSGGDGESDQCLDSLRVRGITGTSCVDAKITFWYALENQEEIEQEKHFHLVAYREQGQIQTFKWITYPVESKENYCAAFVTKPPW